MLESLKKGKLYHASIPLIYFRDEITPISSSIVLLPYHPFIFIEKKRDDDDGYTVMLVLIGDLWCELWAYKTDTLVEVGEES